MEIPKSIRAPAAASTPPRGRANLIHSPAFLLGLALLAMSVWAFLPAVDNDFVGYDDPDYITSNPWVQRGLSSASIRWAFTSTHAANWHPLTWLSHMLDVQFFGVNPAGHHLISILIHATSTLLAFALLRAMTGATWRSFFVAAFFGLHPLRVESVAWVAERKDVLSAMFWMFTLLAYAKFTQRPRPDRMRIVFYLLALFCFAVGLMAKPMLVTLPFVMLLCDYWPLARLGKTSSVTLLLEKLPFLLLSAVACFITFLVQRSSGAVDEVTSLGSRLANVAVSFARYLGKLFVPADLAFFYPQPPSWPAWVVIGAALLLVTITIIAILLRRTLPAALMGWLWYLGTLVPVIGFVAVGQHSMADRYTYIPSFGFFIAVVWGVHAALATRPRWLPSAMAAGGAALLACVWLTRQQSRHWHDTQTLCRHAIRVTTGNFVAHDILGTALEKAGRADEAMREHLEALRINPTNPDAHNNLGVAFEHKHDYESAVRELREAIRLRPRYPDAFYNLGVALTRLDRVAEARGSYLQAVALRPNHVSARFNLGNIYFREGKIEEAAREFERVVEFEPDSADALNNLGVIHERLNRLDQSIGYYQRAILAKPEEPQSYLNLGIAFQRLGEMSKAIQCFREALRLKPDFASAQTGLEDVLKAQSRLRSAAATNVVPMKPN